MLNTNNRLNRPLRVAYILKRYPRFSETFVVNEILAHERAGTEVSIYALRPMTDTHFQPAVADVRAPLTYIQHGSVRAEDFWNVLQPQLKLRSVQFRRLVDAADCQGMDVFQALRLSQMLRERGVDHIHAHFATSATTVARLASALTGIPFSFTAHAKDIFHEYVNPIAVRQKIRDASAVVTVSEYNVRFLTQQFGCPQCKLHRVYNGLPLAGFDFSSPKDRPPMIVAVGRLVEKKGFGDLISACRILNDQGVDFRCEIIGGGELELVLRRQIETLQLGGRVKLRGALPTTQVIEALRQAAVLAVPCITASTGDRDGLPTVLLEAMAVGTPCVATAVTGIPEVVRDDITGSLVPEQQPAELAAALRRLLHDPDLRQKLAESARALIEQEFDIDKNTARLRAEFASARRNRVVKAKLAEVV